MINDDDHLMNNNSKNNSNNNLNDQSIEGHLISNDQENPFRRYYQLTVTLEFTEKTLYVSCGLN
jgi:hypothetical protein